MKKPDSPSVTIAFTLTARSAIFFSRSRSTARWLVRNPSTHAAEQPWAITVAKAAPCTPIPAAKIKMGSSMILMIAPNPTVIIPIFPNPWDVIKGFIPRPIMTSTVPSK